jgi:hypothetical protein
LLTKDLLNEFEATDPRLAFSVKYAPAVSGYYITKFRDASATASTLGYGGNDWILIRYADVILNLSEAYLGLADNVNAIKYLDMVRARAAMPSYATMLLNANYALNYPTLKLAILHEILFRTFQMASCDNVSLNN